MSDPYASPTTPTTPRAATPDGARPTSALVFGILDLTFGLLGALAALASVVVAALALGGVEHVFVATVNEANGGPILSIVQNVAGLTLSLLLAECGRRLLAMRAGAAGLARRITWIMLGWSILAGGVAVLLAPPDPELAELGPQAQLVAHAIGMACVLMCWGAYFVPRHFLLSQDVVRRAYGEAPRQG